MYYQVQLIDGPFAGNNHFGFRPYHRLEIEGEVYLSKSVPPTEMQHPHDDQCRIICLYHQGATSEEETPPQTV